MKTLLAILFLVAATSVHAQTNRFAATIVRVLTSDVSITNQTNMVTVSGLTISTDANKRYAVKLFPIISAAAATTVLQIVASNATVYGFWDGISGGSYGINQMTNENGFGITTARAPVQEFYVVAGTNAGSISIQVRSSVTPNTNSIGIGSYIRADKLPQ